MAADRLALGMARVEGDGRGDVDTYTDAAMDAFTRSRSRDNRIYEEEAADDAAAAAAAAFTRSRSRDNRIYEEEAADDAAAAAAAVAAAPAEDTRNRQHHIEVYTAAKSAVAFAAGFGTLSCRIDLWPRMRSSAVALAFPLHLLLTHCFGTTL